MKDVVKFSRLKAFAFLLCCIASLTFLTCDVGLGESVDTGSPSLSISYPPEGAVIRDWFTLAGTCSDDKAVSRVAITLTNTASDGKTYGPYEATISAGTNWIANINEVGDDGSYPLVDGTYTVNIMVYDDSGHASGPFSRTLEIDNTNPVFIISSPGSFTTTKKYGSNLRISGSVAESHSISQMTLDIYDSTGSSKGSFTIDENIDTTDGCAIDFARYDASSSGNLKKNYEDIYGTVTLDSNGKVSSSNTDKAFKMSVTLADSAYVYQSPETGAATEETGNTTSEVYLYDKVYTVLMGTSGTNLGLTSGRIVGNMNGRYTDRYEILDTTAIADGKLAAAGETHLSVKEFLELYQTDTAGDGSHYLPFSLNPAARPTYVIRTTKALSSSYTGVNKISDSNANSVFESQSSSTDTVTATVTASTASGTNVKEEDFKLWLRTLSSNDFTLGLDNIVSALESTVYGGGTPSGWKEIWPVDAVVSDESDSTFTFTSSYLGTTVTAGNYYLLAITGEDIEGANVIHDSVYGFAGSVSGNPPEITINPISLNGSSVELNDAYLTSSNQFSLSGTVTSGGGNYLQELTVTITGVDEENKNSALSTGTVTELTKTIDWSSLESTSQTFGPIKFSDFTNNSGFLALPTDSKTYKYKVVVKARNAGNVGSSTINFYVDTKAPELEITSIEPAVEGSEFDDNSSSTNTYLNGEISVRASVSDTHLKEVYYSLDGGTSWESLGDGTSQKILIDTTTDDFTDGSNFEIQIKAVDEAGNKITYSSNEYCKETYFSGDNSSTVYKYTIKQESDKPRIVLTTADDSILDPADISASNNLFDLTTKKDLSGTVKDDDGLKTVKIYINNALKETYTITGTKTSYSFNYDLSSSGLSEGVYPVYIEATDKTYDSVSDATIQSYRTSTSPVFYISIDKESPKLTENSIGASSVSKNEDFVLSGTASDTNGFANDGTGAITVSYENEDGSVTGEYDSINVTGITTSSGYKTGSWTQPVTLGSTGLSDGTYTFTISVKDAANRETKLTRTVTVDTTLPAFGTAAVSTSNTTNVKPHIETEESAVNWYNTTSLSVSGTASDASGISAVEYAVYTGAFDSSAISSWKKFVTTAVSGASVPTVTYNGTVDNLVHNESKIALRVTDNAGNIEYNASLGTFNIDDGLPSLVEQTKDDGTSYTVLVNDSKYVLSSGEDSTVLYNKDDAGITFTFKLKDSGEAGIDTSKVYITTDGNLIKSTSELKQVASSSITANPDSSDDSYDYLVSYTIAKADTNSGYVCARIYDNAGNYTDLTLFTVSIDQTAPVLQKKALTFVDDSEESGTNANDKFTVYKGSRTVSGTTETVYYLHASDNHTFTLSGVSTDNRSVLSTDLTLSDGTTTKASTGENPALINSGDAGEWHYNFSLTGFDLTKDIKATILVTDEAGNVHQEGGTVLTIVNDSTAPFGKHEKDANNKDKYFRIGGKSTGNSESEIGGKYSPGTYGSDTTIMIRGYFTEEGSSISQIYYKLFTSEPTASAADAFLKAYNTDTSNTGSFAPLSSEETKTVTYTTAVDSEGNAISTGSESIASNFRTSINFQTGKNYILLVAVDNVGNAALDTTTYEYTNSSNAAVSVNGCYSINVDQTAPSITSNQDETILTNGKSDITISGTATDNGDVSSAVSGIDSVTIYVDVNGTTYSSADSTPKITVEVTDSSDTNIEKDWSAVIDKSIFSSVNSGNFTVYATAADKAGTGNKTTISVASILVDKVAPTITLNTPADADTSTADVEINGTIDLSGTTKDGNTLPDSPILGLQYILKSSYSSSDDSSDDNWTTISAATTEMPDFEISGNYTFDIKSFVTTALTDESDYYLRVKGIDKAGNTGYSAKVSVTVSQDTDRPVIRITNLTDLGEDADPRFVLKYGTKSQVIATVTDDDGIDSIFISETAYTGTGTEPSTSEYSTASGTITFTPGADSSEGKNIDGEKSFYVYVKDSSGKKFYTTYRDVNSASDYLNVPKIKVNDTALSNESNSAVFTYQSDSTSPTVEYIQALAYNSDGTANGAYNDTTGEYSVFEDINASYILGGTEKQKAKFYIVASDASGIDGIALEIAYTEINGNTETAKTVLLRSKNDSAIADSSYTVSGTFAQDTTDSTKASWETGIIDFSKVKTGSVTVKVIPYDKLGLIGNGNATFVADNAGPAIKITSPASETELTGTIQIMGTAIDSGSAGTSNIQWHVPTNAERTVLASKTSDADKLAYYRTLNWNGGADSLASDTTVALWEFDFDGNYDNAASDVDNYLFKAGNPKFDVYDSSTFATNSDYASSGLYVLPVYFMATDELGNVTVKADFIIKHNPDGDKPKVDFTYPTSKEYDSDKNYVTLGGTIRITGSTIIPSSTTTVAANYIQIADENGEFSTTDKTKCSDAISMQSKTDSDGESYNLNEGGYGYDVVTAYDVLASVLGSAVTVSTDADAKKYGFTSKAVMDAWWGIKTSGTASWNIPINQNDEMNPDKEGESTNNITIRACGVNAEGKFGAWTDTIAIHIDDAAPTMTTAVNQYAVTLTSSNIVSSNTAVASSSSQVYESDMYLRGQWYLVLDILDETGVSSLVIKDSSSTSLTEDTDYFVAAINDGTSGIIDSTTEKKGKKVFIPITVTSTEKSSGSYTVSATDADATGHTTTQEFSFNIDNTPPTLEKVAANGTSVDSDDFTSIEDSNYQFIISGSSEDEGSGVEHVLFYYMRKNGTTGTIGTDVVMDPMITTGTDDAKILMSSLTPRPFIQENETFYLYSKAYNGTATTDTFTSASAYDEHVRLGGVVEIDGILHTISAINDKTVTFSPSLTEGKTTSFTAYFPVAQVINNSATEKVSSYSANPFAFEKGDDNDGMPESFSKSGKTWTWDATIHSTNMPDGPVSLVILAFDNAGNVAGRTINTQITNNAPRLAKVYLATDLNSNNKFETEEFESYSIIGKEGKEQESYELEFATFDTSFASNESGIFTAKNKLAVVPEIVGGNGEVKLVAKKDAASATAVTSANGTLISSIANAQAANTTAMSLTATGTSSYSITADNFAASAKNNNFWAYVLTNAQLTGKTTATEDDDGENKSFSFTFWDSTEERTSGTDSQSAVLLVKDFTFDLVDGMAPKTVINPFYWNGITENSIYGSSSAKTVSDLKGHIELEDDIKAAITAGTATYAGYGNDAKVSGIVTFTGTAYDEHSLASLNFTFGSYMTGTIATYNATTSTWTPGSGTLATNGWEASVSSDASDSEGYYEDTVYFGQKGHKVYWTLSIDTEKISDVAKTDVVLTVKAKDLANNETSTATANVSTRAESNADHVVTDGTTNLPLYQMDVVPYVTKVYTKLAKSKVSNWSVYNRTALGHYPVQSVVSNIDTSITLKTSTSEDVVLYGFNLNHSSAKIVSGTQTFTVNGTGTLKIDNSTSGQLGFNVAKLSSGKLNLTVNGLSILNNVNANNSKGSAEDLGDDYENCYNRQPNGDTNNILTDDLVFDVWEFNDRAATPINGTATGITMEVNQVTGMLNYAFANGGLYYSMGGNTNKTTAYSTTNSYSSIYWAGDYDTFAGPSVGFHVDELGYTYSVDSGGDTNTNGSVDKWVLYSSRWSQSNRSSTGTLNGVNSLRLEEIALKTGNDGLDYSLMKYRFLSPEFASTVSGNNTNLYLVYYDALTNQIRFRAGTFSGTNKQQTGGFQDQYTGGNSSWYNTNNCQIIANGDSDPFMTSLETTVSIPKITGRGAGQYVDVAAVTVGGKDIVCAVWYDSDANALKYSYISDPIGNWNTLKGNTTASNWSTPQTIFAEGGEYCHIVADKNNHLHIAAYAGNGDVMYAYLDSYTSTAQTCTVDASGAVGEHLTLDVALNSKGNSIPYIGYYTSAIKMPKYAYLVDPTVEDATATFTQVADGTDSNERFTGTWEVTVVPSPSKMTTNREDKVNIGVWKNEGVLKNSTTGTSQISRSGSGYGATNWSKTFGNGTSNAVFGYQITTSSGTGLETAQMR